MAGHRLTNSQLEDLLDLSRLATPAPWYVRQLDDADAMSLVAISTQPDSGNADRYPAFDSGTVVAATLVQAPRYVAVEDQRWEENARFIVAAANALPALIDELLELRSKT